MLHRLLLGLICWMALGAKLSRYAEGRDAAQPTTLPMQGTAKLQPGVRGCCCRCRTRQLMHQWREQKVQRWVTSSLKILLQLLHTAGLGLGGAGLGI